MKKFKQLFAAVVTLGMLSFTGGAVAAETEAPDALVKRISQEVLDIAKSDKAIQGGNQQRVLQVVEEKILPSVDFQKMTALAAGRFWRNATPEQQQQLTTQFRSLLVYTYSGAISQVRDQKVQFLPMRSLPADTDVEVRSQVLQSRGEPIQLNYRLEKTAAGWRIYDVNVLGAWLVETYKSTFAAEIGRGGIDGLIKALTDKNKSLAGKSGS
ncbi:ABC transporter substrate-binding protein [Actimicrobium sp. CCC2.4]|uniref:MlaC/ttg2D family ABC transporter substrate-binding protein n=1 Tax=Actimicrobium sp. CCC2.4 TaxID=3048606 RepID=UPI002AC8AC80|nr:ABC transporter substrate-binding protein [Actimicrobium sp. CCC2.4]MEB0135498.1 ABC transporter substrate-binding protein [Actimicrobium sp. CCC2.4]WPX32332.1 ABC transporter substrate-binding protein [Actimicrobium sp. CCC2.4]